MSFFFFSFLFFLLVRFSISLALDASLAAGCSVDVSGVFWVGSGGGGGGGGFPPLLPSFILRLLLLK